ncbi:MAG: DUF2975 domain-containing protein [Caulobacteraceae bacterium]
MRALGPASVSSLLKIILDVVRFVLWLAAGCVSLAILAALVLSVQPEILASVLRIDSLHFRSEQLGPMAAGVLLAVDFYLAGAIIIVSRLRRVFETLIAGDPFQPENVTRLRVIGLTLACLELGRYAAAGLSRILLPGVLRIGGGVSFTTWFAVLVIFVLAEVFREGARLRGEAELTI